MNFYGDGAVHDAKTLIWLKYKDQLPKFLLCKLSYAATAVAGGVPPATNVHIKPNERNVQGQAIHRVDHRAKTPGLFNQHTGVKPVETERNHVTDAGQNEAPIVDDNSVQFRHLVGDREKYTTVTNRRRRQTAVYGNGTDDTFTAGLQKHDLLVFQVNKNCDR